MTELRNWLLLSCFLGDPAFRAGGGELSMERMPLALLPVRNLVGPLTGVVSGALEWQEAAPVDPFAQPGFCLCATRHEAFSF